MREREYVGVPIQLNRPIVNDQFEFIDILRRGAWYWSLCCADAVAITYENNNGIFSPGTGPIFLDEVNCSGDETNLGDCPHIGIGFHDCDHNEDAGVICPQGWISYMQTCC